MADLKKVYRATTEQQASYNLEDFREKWAVNILKYTKLDKNWGNLSTYFAIRRDKKDYLYNKSDREF